MMSRQFHVLLEIFSQSRFETYIVTVTVENGRRLQAPQEEKLSTFIAEIYFLGLQMARKCKLIGEILTLTVVCIGQIS